MCGERISSSLKNCLAEKFVKAIKELPEADRQTEVMARLAGMAEILASSGGALQKVRHLEQLLGAGRTMKQMADRVNRALPLSARAALPVGLLALPLAGAHGLGTVALGGVLGGPSLLLMALGTAGILSVLDGVPAGGCVPLRRVAGPLPRRTVPAGLLEGVGRELPRDETQLRRALQAMNPFDFECHVMSFFSRSGMEAWVTAKTNDMGVDGFARHPRGLIVVQCKRHSAGNLVGRPVVQQMRGVMAEHNALRGYLVTTSRFSDKARHSARLSDQLVLVDMPELIRWHTEPPRLDV